MATAMVGGLELLEAMVTVEGLGLREVTVAMVGEGLGLPAVTAALVPPFPLGFPQAKKEGTIKETMTAVHRLPLRYLVLRSAYAKVEAW